MTISLSADTAQAPACVTLFDNGDYSLQVCLKSLRPYLDEHVLIFSTRRQQVRHPGEEQVKFTACLSPAGMQNFIDAMQRQLEG